MTSSCLPLPAPVSGGHLVAVDGRALPLRTVHLRARAAGGIATTKVVMTFVNPFAEVLQLRYLLPLPADGAVAGFSFAIGGRRITGRIDRRDAARAAFERALVDGRTASLLEQERSALFTQELGNVPPGAEIVAEVDVDQPLAWEGGHWEWRFPTAAAPRFCGGHVPDAARIDVPVADREVPPRLHVELAIDEPLAVGGVAASASHALTTEAAGGVTTARVVAAPLDRDVVVRWPVAVPAVGIGLRAARPPAGGRHARDAHGLLTVVPPCDRGTLREQQRDVIVLLDVSGSMSGQPLAAAQRVVAALIESLGENDRLELFAFASGTIAWRNGPSQATAADKTAALRWLMALQASGGTEMHDAIVAALRPLRGDAQRQVVLVTDGQIGFEAKIVAEIRERLPASSRVHVVGVGSAPNRSLTQAAARAGRGVEVLIGIDGDPGDAARRLCARTTAPLVTGLAVTGSAVLATFPSATPDLFAAAPARLALRLRPEGGTLVVRGSTTAGPFVHQLDVAPIGAGSGDAFVSRLVGREQVEDLEAAMSGDGDRSRALAEIERVGLEFGIATRVTSWIAVDSEVTVDPTAPRRAVEVPHELPYGMSVAGLGLRATSGRAKMAAMFDEALSMDAGDWKVIGRAMPRAAIPGPIGAARPESESAPPSKRRRLGAPRTGKRGRLVLRDGATWTFDLEGFDAWSLPARVVIVLADGSELTADVVADASTRSGRLSPGLVVRVVVRAGALASAAGVPVLLRLGDDAKAEAVPIA